MTSVDVGVAESSSSPIGSSIQRTGTGCLASDFLWEVFDSGQSPGSLNTTQSFDPADCPSSESILATLEETITPGGCLAEQSIVRLWTATDACGNTSTHQQIITVVDNSVPEFEEPLPEDITIECSMAIPPVEDVTVTDNCESLYPPAGEELIWINEFHYDNASTDVGEFVEVAGSV